MNRNTLIILIIGASVKQGRNLIREMPLIPLALAMGYSGVEKKTVFSLEQYFPKSDDFRDAPPKTKRNGGAVPFGTLDLAHQNC